MRVLQCLPALCVLQLACAWVAPRSSRATQTRAQVSMSDRSASPILGAASAGMSLLKPVFKAESALQAAAFNLGSYDKDEITAEIAQISSRAPVVILTCA